MMTVRRIWWFAPKPGKREKRQGRRGHTELAESVSRSQITQVWGYGRTASGEPNMPSSSLQCLHVRERAEVAGFG